METLEVPAKLSNKNDGQPTGLKKRGGGGGGEVACE